MASDEGDEMIWATSEGGPRHFVNHLQVLLSLSEVRFDLAALGDLDAPARGMRQAATVWRFTTAPDHMAAMHRRLGLALDTYRARYAEIQDSPGGGTPEDDAPDRPSDAPNG